MELATNLRTWRDRLDPADAGLPRQSLRRAPGLRREEVAQLAGLSVNYLTRLEQGRAEHPSASVVAALARALRLSSAEADLLYRLAGLAVPRAGGMDRHLTPSVQRILDRLGDVPVIVQDAGWTVVAANGPALALVGDILAGSGRDRNVAWRVFTGAADRVLRSDEEREQFEIQAVGDLHAALGRHPEDSELRSLVQDLRARSPRFEALWRAHPARRMAASRKTFEHPEAGRLTVDCDVLEVHGSDLRVIVYTAEPGTPDASALQLLSVLGLERFAAPEYPRPRE